MMDPIGARYDMGGKVAVVTGGGDGIGRATSLLLASAGVRVAVMDRDAEKAGTVLREISAAGGSGAAIAVDVGDPEQVRAAFTDLEDAFGGRLDILVNNAGLAIRATAMEMPLEAWNEVVAVNLTGAFNIARTGARLMTSGGAIVNTASIMGLSGGIYPNVAYQTTKGGIVNMTRALALEWVDRGIRVNAVAPTYVRTAFIAPLVNNPDILATIVAATPMRRLAEPEEIADAIVFLASSAASMITGVTLPVDGGFLAR